MKKEITGRPPRVKDISRTQELKKKGLNNTEISWAILHREDKKQVARWLKVNVGKITK